MKVIEAINEAKKLRPSTCDMQTFIRWINSIEGRIYEDILKKDFTTITKAELEKKLKCDCPHDEIYIYYLCCMIDFYNQEYDKYANDTALFENAYEAFSKKYKRENKTDSTSFFGWW